MALNDFVNTTIKCLTLPAAIITGIQAAIWFTLSLLAIFCYNNIIGRSDSLDETSYGYIIYTYYLQPTDEIQEQYIVHPKALNIFMYVYLVLSFIWLVISISLAWVTIKKKWKAVSKVLICWAVTTIIIAILDITLMSLMASDIQKARSTNQSLIKGQPYEMRQTEYTALGIVMSVVARGYILWILNVVFAIVLMVSVCRQRRKPRRSLLSPINAYQSGPAPFSLYDNVQIDNTFENRGFDSEESLFSPPSSELRRPSNGLNPLSNSAMNPLHPYEYGRPPSNESRLAKIGKAQAPGRRSPPRNVPSPTVPNMSDMYPYGMPPYIPEPDYTPPSSPKLQPKSVLRPKTKYEL